jgi:hypothetical protein
LERNIFSRDRRPYVPRQERDSFRPPPPPIETDYCLKGITREHNVLTAFFEQLSTGVIGRYTLNAQIARGTIKSITLDTVEYAMDAAPASGTPGASQSVGDPNDPNNVDASDDPNDPNAQAPATGMKITKVSIGQTLQGLASGARASYGGSFASPPVSTSSSSSETSAEPAPLGDEESDILKRLMQQRQQELGN